MINKKKKIKMTELIRTVNIKWSTVDNLKTKGHQKFENERIENIFQSILL